MGPCTTCIGNLKTTLSNALTIWPGLNSPRCPPFFAELQVEYFLAITPKSAPLAISCFIFSASLCVLTKICRADADCLFEFMMDSYVHGQMFYDFFLNVLGTG